MIRASPPGQAVLEMKPAARPGPPFNGLGPGFGLSGFGRAKANRAEPGPKQASGPGPFGDAYVQAHQVFNEQLFIHF